MGIKWIDHEKCNGCGICEIFCPQDVIRIHQETKKALVQYIGDCQSCFLCEIECPRNAVHVTPFREKRSVMPW